MLVVPCNLGHKHLGLNFVWTASRRNHFAELSRASDFERWPFSGGRVPRYFFRNEGTAVPLLACLLTCTLPVNSRLVSARDTRKRRVVCPPTGPPLIPRLVETAKPDWSTGGIMGSRKRLVLPPASIVYMFHVYMYTYIYMCVCIYVCMCVHDLWWCCDTVGVASFDQALLAFSIYRIFDSMHAQLVLAEDTPLIIELIRVPITIEKEKNRHQPLDCGSLEKARNLSLNKIVLFAIATNTNMLYII